MSLILDALKRAEQERKLGQTPEAVQAATMSPVAGPSHSRDRSLVVVLAILLLAAAIVIAALLLRSHPATDTAASASLPIVPAQAMRPMPQTQPAQPKPVATPAPAVIADRSNVNNMDDVVATDDGRAENAQAAQVAQGNLPSSNTDAASRASPPKSDRPSGHPKMIVTSNTPGAAVQDNAASDSADADAAPPQPNAMSLRDMPEGYREAFPQLTIDVHVYNDDPEHRFIIVGGNTYHEGSSLPQGPHIVAITSDGVVFEWQGQKVLYGLGSN